MSSISDPNRWTSTHPACRDDRDTWTTSRASAARTPTAPPTADAEPEACPSAIVTASRITSACSTATPARPASPSARAPHCSTAACPRRRPAPYSITSPRATASDRPGASSASIAIPSSAWPAPPAIMPTTLTTSSWLFPPRTSEVQLDEAWSFVAKNQEELRPGRSGRRPQGGLVGPCRLRRRAQAGLGGGPRGRVGECAQEVVEEVKDRLGDRPPALFTSDEHAAYETAIVTAFSEAEPAPRARGAPAARGCRPGGGPPPDWPMRRCARSGRRAGSCPSAGR